jgi:hypothetical protein
VRFTHSTSRFYVFARELVSKRKRCVSLEKRVKVWLKQLVSKKQRVILDTLFNNPYSKDRSTFILSYLANFVSSLRLGKVGIKKSIKTAIGALWVA